jgi:hypothetical protein
VGDDHVRHAPLASLADQHQAFLFRHVPGGEHEPVPGDDGDDGFRLRQQLTVFRHADERAVLLRVAHLVFRIEGGHPDEASPSTRDLRQVLDGRGVHPADRQIQVDSSEHFEAGNLLAREIREAGGGVVMIFEDDAAHPFRAGEPGRLEPIEGARHVVGIGVDVDVDGAGQKTGRVVRSAALTRTRLRSRARRASFGEARRSAGGAKAAGRHPQHTERCEHHQPRLERICEASDHSCQYVVSGFSRTVIRIVRAAMVRLTPDATYEARTTSPPAAHGPETDSPPQRW